MIIGWINVTVVAKGFSSPVKRVEFYLDGNLEKTDYDEPYYWICDDKSGDHSTIKTVLYTDTGQKSAKINVQIQKGKQKQCQVLDHPLQNILTRLLDQFPSLTTLFQHYKFNMPLFNRTDESVMLLLLNSPVLISRC